MQRNKEAFLKEGSPAAFKVKAGSGPRHLTFRQTAITLI